MILRGDAARLPLPSKSVDLVIGSPPYLEARTYGIDAGRKLEAWIEWMLRVTAEAVRVSRGLVIWICAGSTKKWCYQPGPEGLLYEWVKRGGIAWRPVYWFRVGIPGSGGAQWYRADVEYALAFTATRGKLPYGHPKANGHPPKWAPGGEMSHRLSDGARVNRDPWGSDGNPSGMNGRRPDGRRKTRLERGKPKESIAYGPHAAIRNGKRHTKGLADGTMEEQFYIPPAIANPGNLLKVKVGGGLMGHKLAHENEAPFPIGVPEFFIRSHCPPLGKVLDPFDGSGSTPHAALNLGRRYIGIDIRQSQCVLTRRRLRNIAPALPFADPEDAA